ncbi:MAG: hypothetical protein U1F54_23630 [Burkholderiales bacterium]
MSDADFRRAVDELSRSQDPRLRSLAALARAGDAKGVGLVSQVAASALPLARSVRRRSSYEFLGMPLYSIALGPDLAKGEARGHARGVLAIGDLATGIVAIGGLAKGVVAVGGLAVGLVAIGGLAVGGLAVGGAALGFAALGGGAVGYVAVGGAAFGVYASGGAAFGEHVISAAARDPEAVRFFSDLGLGFTPGRLR